MQRKAIHDFLSLKYRVCHQTNPEQSHVATLNRIDEVKLLGVWVTTYLDWDKNTGSCVRRLTLA